MTIFINYRTTDELGAAVLIKRELSRRFGDDNVFIAIDTIPPGNDFERELLRRVRSADVLLVVVGTRWLTALGPGGRAIDQDDDWVRREIAEALRCGVQVVPILVDGAARLTNAELPVDIAQLARLQYLRFRHEDCESDLTRIADQLTTHVPTLRRAEPTDSSTIRMSAHVDGDGDVYQAGRDQIIHHRGE
ncbi:MAG TPA: toll/interleukin-1 receptor domain-containing protein [Pseudonocardiaceae bacterium]|nr:toll/interleukin-1 receptor domain-containing protein [Pseudonocardiaceae bacterium]